MEQDLQDSVPADARLYAEPSRGGETGSASGHVTRDLVKGLVAGIVATSAMAGTRNIMYAKEDPRVREREARVRKGAQLTPMQVPTREAAEAAGASLSKEKERRIGDTLAWGLGIAGVAGYAVMRKRVKGLDAAQGLAFGAGMWALEDELMMPLLGFTPGPTAYPWQAHWRGLVSHLAYGVTAETTLDALDRFA